MTIFETDRIILREIALSDLDDLYAVLSDEQTMVYYPRPYTREEVKGWIKSSIESYKKNKYGLWAVVLKADNTFIGQCGISNQNIDGQVVPEIGYQLNKAYWNKGYATEAAAGCLKYGFETLQLPEIYIHTSTANVPSARVAEKLKFTKIKEYEKYFPASSTTMEHVVYVMKNELKD